MIFWYDFMVGAQIVAKNRPLDRKGKRGVCVVCACTEPRSRGLCAHRIRFECTQKKEVRVCLYLLHLSLPSVPLSYSASNLWPVVMRRIIIKKKLLWQCMLDSVDDDLVGCVLHNLVNNFLRKRRVSKIRKRGCCLRRWHQRKSWEEFSADLTERQFCRYFCMSHGCFDLLCTKIERNVGEGGAFKSEKYLRELQSALRPPKSVAEVRMRTLVKAHSVYTGGIICGDVKSAITLRMLAGGSNLDYLSSCHFLSCHLSMDLR